MGSSLKIIFDPFFRLVFSGYCFYVLFLFLRNFHIFSIFFFHYFTRSMKIIKGCRHWVLTEESPGLTTMAVLAGYYTRSFFPLPAFLNDVAGIHQGIIKLNEIKTPGLEFFLTCIECDSLCSNIFVSSQELSCRHKPMSDCCLVEGLNVLIWLSIRSRRG